MGKRAGPRKERPVKPLDEAGLEKAAIHYLRRFPSSEANLRRVLKRKFIRQKQRGVEEPEESALWIDGICRRFVDRGLLDDGQYAKGLAQSLHRQGRSLRAIVQKLKLKGLGEAEIANAMDGLRTDGHGPDPDLLGAHRYAKRRRLGPYARDPEMRKERRHKDLAALARQGYHYGIASKVIDGDPLDNADADL